LRRAPSCWPRSGRFGPRSGTRGTRAQPRAGAAERGPLPAGTRPPARPRSQGVARPVVALFAAGVSIVGGETPVGEVLTQPVVLAIVLGLVVGKLVGVLGVTALVTRFTPLRLAAGIGVRDLLPVGFLAGIGFTVSLLIAELSFPDAEHTDGAKIAILAASTIAAVLAALALRWDARRARSNDMNRDDLPDDVTDFIGDPKDRLEH
ncbi:Na+/H+ antiporter NhaA, partial [uncultured Cellulosimicrobium sp.]|uniref:Na+/H+ antiporter NhaA n=1 Tax=uncultured Cellulosimicrobium sp. TaxID=307826 RepID=UPI002595706D